MQRRKRVPVACEQCRRRRIRCDANKPTCGNCNSGGMLCNYIEVRSTDVAQSEATSLLKRLDKLEENVRFLDNSHSGLMESYVFNNPLDGTAEPDKMSPNLLFNHRLSVLKAYCGSNQKTSYLSDIFLSVLNTSEILILSEKLGDALLGKRLEEVSLSFESTAREFTEQFLKSLTNLDADSTYLNRCIDIYLKLQNPFIYLLLDPIEVQNRDWLLLPDIARKSVTAALIILGSVTLRMTSDFEDFALSKVKSQEMSAYYQVVRILNSYRFIAPNLMQVRLSMLLLWLLYTYSSVPSVLHFLPTIIEMAKAVGIDDPEANNLLPSAEADARRNVWFFVVNFQYLVATTASTKLLVSPKKNEIPISLSLICMDRDINVLRHSADIYHIFDEAYHLFLASDRNQQHHELFEKVLSIDAKLSSWKSNLPDEIWRDDQPFKQRLYEYFIPFSSDLLKFKYYHTVITVHSALAFSHASVPYSLRGSLEKVSDAARALLSLAIFSREMKGDFSVLENNCITSAVFCLFCKQLFYPNEPSNYKDLLILQRCLGKFSNTSWTSISCKFPPVIIWEFLIEIMARYQYNVNLTAADNSPEPAVFEAAEKSSGCIII